MGHIIIEIKARCADLDRARCAIESRGARRVGLDHQVDTYFHCPHGRLKLREGNIERALIHYLRPDQAGPKCSEVILYQPQPGDELKQILARSLGVLVVVDKRREIYFADNLKLHLDLVEGLGSFVEIEAIGDAAHPEREGLLRQCQEFMEILQVQLSDLIERSYSDLLLEPSGERRP